MNPSRLSAPSQLTAPSHRQSIQVTAPSHQQNMQMKQHFEMKHQLVEDVSDTTTEEEPSKPKRRIYYKPYRLKNLKALPQVRELPKGIGPKEVPTQQIERREHMLSYASRVWSRNKLTKKR